MTYRKGEERRNYAARMASDAPQITVNMTRARLDRITEYARKRGVTRSEAIGQAVDRLLEDEQ
jgi:hypothetical protein